MKKSFFLLLTLLTVFANCCFSQNSGSIKGQITDTVGKQNLAEATVAILHSLDNSQLTLVETNRTGEFYIRNIPPGDYRLSITFEGYEPISKRFSITSDSSGGNVDFGVLFMDRRNDTLKAVVIERPPIQIKKDTVEFNAGMYSVKPNAVAEDLLKKMPGMQVDKSGNITAQGETVQRVMVNGKRFFSDDPKLATRNLPPEMIDKIQVFDDLSDQSKFTGFDDGNRVKTINIITKKNAQQGYFGKAVGGAGTNQDYDESLNMHRFDGNQQISLLGQANDINKQNFTIQDILGNSGGRRGGGGGSPATNQFSPSVTTVWAGGINYRDNWGPNTDAYGSYFYNNQHVATYSQDTLLKQIGDSANYGTGHSASISQTSNHRFAFNLEHRFDSSNSLIFRPNFSFQTTTPHGSSFSSTTDNNNLPVNSLDGHSSSTNSGFNINNANIQFRHKFSKPFRTISLDFSTTANVNNGFGYQYSVDSLFKQDSAFTINQYYNDSLHSYTLTPTLSYTEPIGKNQIIEFRYSYTYNHSNTINNTYDFSDSTKSFDKFDSLFSNSYKFNSHSNNFTLSYRLQNPNKFNLSIGSGVQFTEFISINTTKDITVAHNYINLTPTVNFQYSFSTTQRLRFYYMGRTGTPTPSQLQPLTTTTDDINFQSGNPDLKPQFTHSVRLLYASFDAASGHTIFATINGSTTVNDIQGLSVPTASGGDSSTYVNLNGTYNLNAYFNYGIVLKKPKSNLNFISSIVYSQFQSLLDQRDTTKNAQLITRHNYTRNTTLSETISWTTNIKKNFDMNFSYNPVYTIGSNSIEPSTNQNYFKQIFSAEFTAYTNGGWLIAAEFDYTYFNSYVPGYNISAPILTPSIAKQLFKKKNGELRFTVFDVFDKNAYVSKTQSSSSQLPGFTINKTNVLSRYAMLTFTYNLNNFAGANQRRMPGMFNNFPRNGGGGGGGGGGRRVDF
jgi:Outer membrane protein beta-barrel family/Carboxypeptidase regulatory-like domain